VCPGVPEPQKQHQDFPPKFFSKIFSRRPEYSKGKKKRKKTRLDIKLLRKRVNKCNIMINATNKPLEIFFVHEEHFFKNNIFNYKE